MGGSTMGMDTLNTKSGMTTAGGDFVETSSIHNLTRPVTPVLTRRVVVKHYAASSFKSVMSKFSFYFSLKNIITPALIELTDRSSAADFFMEEFNDVA